MKAKVLFILGCIVCWVLTALLVAKAQDGLDLPVSPNDIIPVVTHSVPISAPAPAPPQPVQPPKPPGPSIYGHDLKSENSTIVYVLDTSGSMTIDNGQYVTPDGAIAQGDRLDRAKGALIASIRSLPETWKFDIIAYQCDITMWNTALVPAGPVQKEAAEKWLSLCVFPGGATATGPAVAEVFNTWMECHLVVLLTDGAPNCGAGDEMGDTPCIAAHRSMIKGSNKWKATINVFGIGATGAFKQFCEDVANDSGGTYTDVR